MPQRTIKMHIFNIISFCVNENPHIFNLMADYQNLKLFCIKNINNFNCCTKTVYYDPRSAINITKCET